MDSASGDDVCALETSGVNFSDRGFERENPAARLAAILRSSEWHCRCLHAAALVMRDEGIGDYLLAAGFVRHAVWDTLHGAALTKPDDVDVIYLGNPAHSPDEAKAFEEHLTARLQQAFAAGWEVKDQRRMHLRHGDAPYQSLAAAMTVWPEQETAVGVRFCPDGFAKSGENLLPLDNPPANDLPTAACGDFRGALQEDLQADLEIVAPWGLDGLFALTITPTPRPAPNQPQGLFHARVASKNWLARYPKLRINR
ncbi:nucleotidyltransferase family protein [Shewanella sp. JM162201]|uniref:Nucleotidyltransferase family protein n=1 Tax=Shewanella jiangmenensis TaxID=2837387 RepID=A0ABS5V544_9GAMM|nr:nucleotidyltransferase family protein [Shewanella jiangmenensis]MBT1444965.1 nucleotidyltransferase family protein [Shewanella jiangmenensis]